MAHIRANTKNGKIVSYRFTVCLGRDCNGKQIRKYTTWPTPPDTSTAKAKHDKGRTPPSQFKKLGLVKWMFDLTSQYNVHQ